MDILKEIERKYDIDKIMINGVPFWPFFRALIYSELLKSKIRTHDRSATSNVRKLRKAAVGFYHWFLPHKFVFFSTELERKMLDGLIFDKLTDRVIEILQYDKCLYIEQAEHGHLFRNFHPRKESASLDFILVIAGLLKVLRLIPVPKIEGEEILQQIESEYQLDIDHRDKLKLFLCKAKAVSLILKMQRPKRVFITDYGFFYITFACKRLNIPVIEFQHGVIGDSHPYYHPAKPLSEHFTPDYLLVFGDHDRQSLQHGRYINGANIFTIGNYYLDRIFKSPPQQRILHLTQSFSKSICVPTDFVTHEYLLSFILNAAAALADTLFIIVPREKNTHTAQALPPNVIVEESISFQEIVRHCTFNTSTYSTCCLEALALGVQNILINEDGLAKKHFGSVLTDCNFTAFVKNSADYVNTVKNFKIQPKQLTQTSIHLNFKPDYDSNVKSALKRILE